MFFVEDLLLRIDVYNSNGLHVSTSMAIKNRNDCNASSKLPYENKNKFIAS